MKQKTLKKLLELLAGGLPLDNAWEQAGFLAKAEAEDALREMASELGKEMSAGRPEPSHSSEPVSAGKVARTVDLTIGIDVGPGVLGGQAPTDAEVPWAEAAAPV